MEVRNIHEVFQWKCFLRKFRIFGIIEENRSTCELKQSQANSKKLNFERISKKASKSN